MERTLVSVAAVLFVWEAGLCLAQAPPSGATGYVQVKTDQEGGDIVFHVTTVDEHGFVKEGAIEYVLTRDDQEENQRADFMQEFLLAMPFDLDFPGGGTEALFQHIRDRFLNAYARNPEELRPLLPKEPLTIQMKIGRNANLLFPPLQVKAVSMNDLTALLEQISPPATTYGMDMAPKAFDPDQADDPSRWVLSAEREAAAQEFAVYNLNGLPGAMSAEGVKAAFETAWKMPGKAISATATHHEGTKTLMVLGSEEEVASATKVYQALTSGAGGPSGGQLEALVQALRALDAEVKDLKEEMAKPGRTRP